MAFEKKNTRPQGSEKKKKEKNVVDKNSYNLFEDRERVLDAFESKIFPIKTKAHVI